MGNVIEVIFLLLIKIKSGIVAMLINVVECVTEMYFPLFYRYERQHHC